MDEGDYGGGKSFVLSPGRKSLSMSNLVRGADSDLMSSASGCGDPSGPLTKSKMKAFLSSRNLDELQISIRSSRSKSRTSVKSASNLSRLLDRVTDDEDELAAYDEGQADEDVCIFPGKGN